MTLNKEKVMKKNLFFALLVAVALVVGLFAGSIQGTESVKAAGEVETEENCIVFPLGQKLCLFDGVDTDDVDTDDVDTDDVDTDDVDTDDVDTDDVDTDDVDTDEEPVLGEDTVIAFGQSGSFHAVYDSVVGNWTLGMWETSRVDAGWTLAELKKNGDSFEFVMPFNAVLNMSAGEVFIDDVQWNLGNPVVDPDMITKVIPAGSVVKVIFSGTESDGLQVWFVNE